MHRTLTALLIALLFVTELPARSSHDWDKVKRLHQGTSVEVFLWKGAELDGEIERVNDTGLRLAMVDYDSTRVGPMLGIDRTNIRKIVRVPHDSLPNPHKWMLIGAGGGAIGVTTSAVTDLRTNDHEAHGLTGGLGGAGLGFFASIVALGVAGTVVTAKHIHGEITRIVYEDTANPPPDVERQGPRPNHVQ